MDRLTEMNENKTAHFYPQCFEKCGGIGYSKKCHSCHLTDRVCDKLGEYEDLEEQGKLLKLPVAVGDMTYWADKYQNKVRDFVVNKIEIEAEGILIITSGAVHCVSEFGRTVFSTKGEAEAALKEMGARNE